METQSHQKTKDKMVGQNSHISIIILKVNGLNSPIKRHRKAGGSENKTQPYPAFENTSQMKEQILI